MSNTKSDAAKSATSKRAALSPARRAGEWLRYRVGAESQVLVALVLLTAYFALSYSDTFATSDNVANMLRQGSILLVVTVGQSFALLVGGFDLSIAANMAFASTVSALAMSQHGKSPTEAVILGLVAGAVVGFVNGVMIAALGITPFIATLGTLTFLGGYSNQLAGGASISGLPPQFMERWGGGDWGPIPSAVGLAIIGMVVAWLVLARSRLGLYLYALGGSREASRLAGIRVVWIEIAAYTLTGLLAGLAGIMLSARVGVGQAELGSGYELLSIAAAVMGGVAIGGGTGRLFGVLLGVGLFTVLQTGLNIAGATEFTQQMITGVVLIVAVVLARFRGSLSLSSLIRRRNPKTAESVIS